MFTLNISFATLADPDHHYRKETDEIPQTTPTSIPTPPISSMPRSSLSGKSLTPSALSDGNQNSPFPHWGNDGPLSPTQPPFLTRHSARHPSETYPTTPTSDASPGSPSENDLGCKDVRSPPAGTDQDDPPRLCSPIICPREKGHIVDPIRENANATDHSKADGLSHNEGSTELGLEEAVEMEIDGLLEELTGYHSKRTTMSSAPLLPLPEEFSPTDGPISSQPYADHSFPPLKMTNILCNGDSDTPSLTPSSPQSSKGSHFSPTSPSLKSKKSFTPITPSTDGWRTPSTLAAVLEHKASNSDITWDNQLGVLSESRRAHHTSLPPLRKTIPEDSTIQRRTKALTPPEPTPTDDHSRIIEVPIDRTASSYFSDDDISESTEIGYIDSSFDPAYLPVPSTISSQLPRQRPRLDAPRGSESGSFYSKHSSILSVSSGSTDYPSSSDSHYTLSPKRGVLRSIFSQNDTFGKKKEQKRAKVQDSIQTQSLADRSMDAVSSTAASSEPSKDKERRNAEKAAKAMRRAQLAEQLKEKPPKQVLEKSREGARKGLGTWEERGGMYSLDGIFQNSFQCLHPTNYGPLSGFC